MINRWDQMVGKEISHIRYLVRYGSREGFVLLC